jgi:Tol biopolymer transport system component
MRTLAILLTLLAVAGLAEQPAVAIVDFEAKNCDQGIADAVSEIMRTEIIATGRFRVIERAQLARVMEEHAFQMSGLVEASTIAELGKLVGADYVAVGSVSGLGGTYTVAVRYIDVETAEAALGKTETATSESGLPDVCRRLAAALTGLPTSGSSSGDNVSSSVSSSSGRIAFASDRDGDWEIFVMDADGRNQTQLTYNGSNFGPPTPSWSPDGHRIAFDSDRDGDSEILVMDADGSNQTQLTFNDDWDYRPVWSPDGLRIAFISSRGYVQTIFVMDTDGRNQTQLTNIFVNPDRLVWSPDGRHIAFEGDIGDNKLKVFKIDKDGSNQKLLLPHEFYVEDPAWSPDGRCIVFKGCIEGHFGIFITDANGSNLTRLNYNYDDYNPTWSPDGRHIAFDSTRDGDREIFVMDADGRNVTQLTDNTSNDAYPAWCPVE